MALRSIIFDLGGTLIEYHTPHNWERPGLEAFRHYLAAQGYAAPSTEDLLAIHLREVAAFHTRLNTDPHANLRQDEILRATLADAHVSLPAASWETARERYYQASYTNGKTCIDGALETLSALHAQGFRLAALSNTAWPRHRLDVLLDQLGLLRYLPVRFYSCDEAAWKPWPTIFKRTLDALGLAPEEAVYVGDYYEYDVQGAQGVGMRAVWLRQPGRSPIPGVTPDASINTLPELLTVIDQWRHE